MPYSQPVEAISQWLSPQNGPIDNGRAVNMQVIAPEPHFPAETDQQAIKFSENKCYGAVTGWFSRQAPRESEMFSMRRVQFLA